MTTNQKQDANTAREIYGKVIAKAWTDKEFKSKLMSDPKSALAGMGIDIPVGMTIKVVEDAPNSTTLVLPAPPKEGEIAMEDLESIVGGTGTETIFCGL